MYLKKSEQLIIIVMRKPPIKTTFPRILLINNDDDNTASRVVLLRSIVCVVCIVDKRQDVAHFILYVNIFLPINSLGLMLQSWFIIIWHCCKYGSTSDMKGRCI